MVHGDVFQIKLVGYGLGSLPKKANDAPTSHRKVFHFLWVVNVNTDDAYEVVPYFHADPEDGTTLNI